MKIRSLSFQIVKLPFRFAFKHSLAERRYSRNIIASAIIEDKNGQTYQGFGESVPRDYVTGETPEESLACLQRIYAPNFINREFNSPDAIIPILQNEFKSFGLEKRPAGATWCALELAILDGVSRALSQSLLDLFGTPSGFNQEAGIRYGGVIPFSGRQIMSAVLLFYKFYGFETVKLKVGSNFEEDVERIKMARSILGNDVTLRIDANAAWSADQTIRFAERVRKFKVASIEQPVPAQDLKGMAKITRSIPEEVVADESLCTIEQAEFLAEKQICSGFNIRLSKVGGFLPAARMVKIAQAAGIACHLGAQVGESGILSSAGRIFAAIFGPFENCEGSANGFLLKRDLTKENLTAGLKGIGKLQLTPGLGITVLPERIKQLSESYASAEAEKANALSRCS